MSRKNAVKLAQRLTRSIRRRGVRATGRAILGRITEASLKFPLAGADRNLLFATDIAETRRREKQRMRATSLLYDASQVQSTYPEVFEWNGHLMRYAFLPALEASKGLVVLFHGHNAYLHMGPMERWRYFDVLAPWDTFGWRRQGSWFWGEKGRNFVEEIVVEMIRRHGGMGEHPWFCFGGSMGGFAALYHGIKYQCWGIYAAAPQVDLRAKVVEYGVHNRDNPYGYLQGETLDTVPDLFEMAREQEELPPLYLMQHQFDPVNPFADHGYRLLAIYNEKRAWYGVRIHPAIGHRNDGSQKEAEYFFSLIVDKKPPKRFPA